MHHYAQTVRKILNSVDFLLLNFSRQPRDGTGYPVRLRLPCHYLFKRFIVLHQVCVSRYGTPTSTDRGA